MAIDDQEILHPTALPNELFFSVYDPNESTLVLRAIKDFRDRNWGSWFGPIQKSLKEKIWLSDKTKPINKCIVNMVNCEWADPIPLLSLSISLLEYEDSNHHVKIVLPSDKKSATLDIDSLTNQKRFLRFLAREGFLYQLANPEPIKFPNTIEHTIASRTVVINHPLHDETGGLTWTEEFVTKSDISNRFQDLGVSLIFEDCTTLPATILKLRNAGSAPEVLELIDEWVERTLIEILDSVIRDRAPSWAQSGVKYRLLMSLRETLHNIAEHAYTLDGYAGVYIRYRAGALSKDITPEVKDAIEREESSSGIEIRRGEIDLPFAYYRSGFFESFIIDSGNGILKTISGTHNEITSLNKAMRAIFDDGLSRKNKADRITALGGLHLLAQILEPVNDHILLLDNDNWWGAQLPLPSGVQRSFKVVMSAGGAQPAYYTGNKNSENEEIYIEKPNGPGIVKGFYWVGRHSWRQDTAVKRDKDPWAKPNDQNDIDRLLLEYSNQDIKYLPTVDLRISSFKTNDEPQTNKKSSSLLFLPGPRWMRNKIQTEIAKAVITAPLLNNSTLIIGDILPEEAHTFLAAIRDAHGLSRSEFSVINKLVLVTRDLKVAVLNRSSGRLFAPSPSQSDEFIKHDPIKFSPHISLAHYLRALRVHDSKRIWNIVNPPKQNSNNSAFRQVEVEWHNETTTNLVLNGYLDFAQTLTHPVCREIYAISLHRLLGLYRYIYRCNIEPMDSLVESTVVRFNAEITSGYPSLSESQPYYRIIIGSILVSGQTENACPDECKKIYFFSHPSGTCKSHHRLLCWLGDTEPQASLRLEPPRYRRVGRTPMIAMDGWKAYRIPRFEKDGISAYVKSPKDSYKVWQEPSRSLMKFGHWSYGGHHDLLTINLLLAFDTELDRVSLALGSSLARFLFSNFFKIFELSADHLTESGKFIFNAIEKESDQLKRYLLPNDLAAQNPVLIYPSHAVTDHVINRFISLINDESKLRLVRSRLRGILPVRRHRSGSGMQVSGLVLEWLESNGKRKLKSPPATAVIFDDAIISGRTYHDLKGLLREYGFKKIYSISMLDRQRLPATGHIISGRRTCYWRLDVPTLGGEDHCPLCHALSRAKAFQRQLAFPNLVTSWINDWEEKNPATEWGNTGLRPIYLKLKKTKRKFGIEPNSPGSREYRQIGGDSEQVSITNSAGLVCWMTEMHANTARDDLSTTFPDREPNLSPLVKIQLLSSQLLLFMGEFDRSQAHSMRLAILEALWSNEIELPDMTTSLGVLSLLASETNSLKEAVANFCNKKGPGLLNARHSDFLLLIAYCISQGLLEDSPTYAAASRLLKSNKTRADIYYRFHRETMDVSGAAHTPPLRRLANAAAPLNIKGLIQDHSIEASLMQINSLLDDLSQEWLNISLLKEGFNDPTGQNHIEDFSIKSFRNNADTILVLISELGKIIEIDSVEGTRSKDKFYKAKELATTFLNEAEMLHKSLFRPLQIKSLREGNKCNVIHFIETTINDLNRDLKDSNRRTFRVVTEPDSCKNLKENLTECYIPWDTDIASEIRRMLSNIRHASEDTISCPFNLQSESENESVCAWILVSLEHSLFKITMVNTTSGISSHRKSPTHHHIFSDFRGNIEYIHDTLNNRITTTASWAYAHTLADIN